MNCRKARWLIHLREGGDASRGQIRRIGSHLERCPRCHDYDGHLVPLPLSSFRQDQPLTENDFASIRREVMLHLPARRGAWWFALRFAVPVTVVVALFVIGLAVRRSEDGSTIAAKASVPTTTPQVVEKVSEPLSVAQVETNVVEEAPVQPIRIAATASNPVESETRGTETPRSASPAAGATIATATPQPAPIRIELKTRDPNIRIIWIANNQPLQPTDDLDGTSGT